MHEVGVHRRPGEDADASGEARRIAARVFEGGGRKFQQDAMLRVHHPRFARRVAEKRGVKTARFVENGGRLDVVARSQIGLGRARLLDVVVGKLRD